MSKNIYASLINRLVTILTVTVLIVLFSTNNAHSSNWPWDQGHDCVETKKGSGSWGRWDYDGNWRGTYSSKECCELFCKICPVYANTGRLQKTFTDLTVPGIGPALTITRTYDSQEWANSLLGYGWIFNFGKRLIISRNIVGEKIVVVRLETGEKNFYKEYPDDTLERYTDYGATYDLIKNTDNTYTIKNRDGSRHELREDGKIAKVIDKNNNELVFTYNTVGCLTRITNASGNYVDLVLGPNGKIANISDNLGRTINYGYDDNGNLTSVTDPMGNTTQYIYNIDNLLVQTIDARGNTVETVAYDNNQPPRVSIFIEKGETYTIAYFSDRTEKSDSSGNTWTYYYNDVGVITKVIDPLGNVKEQFPNKITSTSLDWEEDLNGNRTSYTYDADGNVASKTDPLGSTITYTYVAGTNLVETETDPMGHVTKYEYDAYGNNTRIIRDYGGALQNQIIFTYDSIGNQTSVTDPIGNTTTYEYDVNGNLTKLTDPLGNITTYTYDSRGNRLTGTDADGNTTTYTYDLLNRLISVTDALGNTTTYTYDANGNLISQTDANGNSRTFTYDAYNRLVQATDPLGNTISYTYDSRDNMTSMTDANGNTTAYTYDILNRILLETNALGGQTTYTYDAEGNILTITDANGKTTTFAYDALNRVIKTTSPDGTFETFSYDTEGNLTAMTDRNGNTINNTFDSLHRLTVKTYPDATTINYTYDTNSNILTASNSELSYAFTYDALNRATQVTNVTTGKTVSYSYLCCGLNSSMTDPEDGITTYIYDALKRLTSLTNPQGETTSYTYDNLSRTVRKDLANGSYTTYNYDAASRLASLINKTSTNSVISSYSYTYDNTSNRTSMTTLAGTHNYTYDKIYELLQASHPISSTETYTYDPVFNRLTSASYSNWTHDNNNRLTSYNGTSFTYDANGNSMLKTDATGTTNYQYDYENKLIRVDYPDGTYSEYRYDPFGNRIKKDVNGTVTWFVYDLTKNLPDVIAEYNGGGSLLASYTHGLGIDEVISIRRGGNSYFHLKNGLGSITTLTDNTETVVNTYEYDAFGNVVSSTVSIANPYGYTGRKLDNESGLMYYRVRYYDPGIGRFISADPIAFAGGINFYVYVRNNPVNFVDPLGLVSCDGKWRQVGWDRIFNIVCVCYWLCEPCDGPTIWGGNPRTLPRTFGTVINAGGDIESGDDCICKNEPGTEKDCCKK